MLAARSVNDESLYVTVRSDVSSPRHSLSEVLKLVMNLQRVANHPQLVEPATVVSPFHMDEIDYYAASLVQSIFDSTRHDVCFHL